MRISCHLLLLTAFLLPVIQNRPGSFRQQLNHQVLKQFPFLQSTETPQPTALSIDRDEVLVDIPEKLTFVIEASHPSLEIEKVVLHYSIEQLSCQDSVTTREVEIEAGAEISGEWEIDFSDSGAILPGTDLWHRWEITLSDGTRIETAVEHLIVKDQRHTWQTIKKGELELYWYRGDRAFGEYLMSLVEKSVRRLSDELGIELRDPIRVTVYPNSEELREVLVVSHDWTGAVADPDLGLILIPSLPGSEGWARDVIPHEVTHLAVSRLTFNCSGIRIPTWLSEGLAMHVEGEMDSDSYAEVITSLESDRLSSLRSLASGFSAYSAEAATQYTQSQMVVDYMVAEYGTEKLAMLLSFISGGLPIDQALNASYGFDTDGLDAYWRKSLGFTLSLAAKTTPIKQVIPTLALWTSIVQPSATDSPTATSTTEPAPTSTPVPQVSNTLPALGTLALPVTSRGEDDRSNPIPGMVLVIAALLLFLTAGAVYFWFIKKRRQM